MLLGKHISGAGLQSVAPSEPSLADKIEFLTRRDAYQPPAPEVTRQETHMSQVFLAGDRVYKLKKPVRFPYLDFSTLARREAACRAELKLNRRLAPDIYRDVLPLVLAAQGLAIGGDGEIVDWLVVDELSRRDADARPRHRGRKSAIAGSLIDVAAVLVQFYRRASRRAHLAQPYAAELWRSLAFNRRILLDPRFQPSSPDACGTSTPCSAVS